MRKLTILGTVTATAVLTASAVAAPDRVEFPADYESSFTQYFAGERANGEQYAIIYANDTALDGAKAGLPLPSGSKMVMEIYKPKTGIENVVVRDPEGHVMKGDMAAIAVIEKQEGWGEAYPEDLRTGDWDFALFTPSGELKGNDATACLQCHVPMSETDYLHSFDRLQSRAAE
ncbi:MAG: hypothetical protein CMM50_13280 [Rhodospirillaceae bacterium]|nr:hypothetical protein [Rhodospirillaceae bacterium]